MISTIGIDARLSGLSHAGIGRYSAALIRRLIPSDEFRWWLLFSSKDQAEEVLQTPLSELPDHVSVAISDCRHYSIREQIEVPQLFAKANLDLLHVPHFNVPFLTALRKEHSLVVTIHDLLWHEQRGTQVTTLPWWQYWIKYLGYRFITRTAVTRADHVLVPTHAVKETVTSHYSEIKDKISVTYEGVDASWLSDHEMQTTASPVLDLDDTLTHLVYVGSLYPHKNIERVLDAAQKNQDLHLHIVGARSAFLDETKQLIDDRQIQRQVTIHGYLSDEVLRFLLQQSDALVQPSISEGFGLTGLEGMAAGVPVVASDIPVFREVYGEAALYFDPHSASSLLKAIQKVDRQRVTLIKSGKKQLQQYSWDKMTEETLTIYRKVLSS